MGADYKCAVLYTKFDDGNVGEFLNLVPEEVYLQGNVYWG